MSPLGEVGREEVLWLLGSISGLYRLPFDAALIAQQYPPPYSISTLHEAARSLGLKTGTLTIAGIDWQKLPLPAIAFLRPVPQPLPEAQTYSPENELTLPAPEPTVVLIAEESKAESATPLPPSRTPVLILKTDGHKLLYFRTGSQTPETIAVEEAAQWFEPD